MVKNPVLYNEMLIIGIIILLICVVVTPNICGYDKKTNAKKFNESKACLPLNNDFINAFWRLNECSGDTVGDSSGHNYDGKRNGANWITDGYSGCALDFDGLDDYVNLTDHSEEIGFNKTDDFIITFYFKSTQNDHGIIMSYTGYKNVPEFRIELQPNGSILFKAWTGMCGLVLFSDEGYNNGSWHNVYIKFNGITTDPTVDIYIDDNLDATLTDWLCDIASSDFLAAAIGKRASDDSGFFDGVIDEFRFIKYEGGNEQVPPLIDGPTHVKPSIENEFTFTMYDPEGDDIWIIIDWGDGDITDWLGPFESGETVTLTHKWDEEGIYCIRAKSRDFWDESRWSECFEVRVGNQPPDPPIITGPRYGDPGQVLTYTFKSYDFEGQDIYYVVDWNDGTITETDYGQSNTSIQISHSWEEEGDYNITARAVDIKGKESDTSVPLWIRIGDKPPKKPDIDGPIKGPIGVEVDLIFTAIDPENDKVRFNIKWGDGEEINVTDWYNSEEPATITHIWVERGVYKIEVRAQDMFGFWSSWASFVIEIPRNRVLYYNMVELIFERFPLFERLVSLIKMF